MKELKQLLTGKRRIKRIVYKGYKFLWSEIASLLLLLVLTGVTIWSMIDFVCYMVGF